MRRIGILTDYARAFVRFEPQGGRYIPEENAMKAFLSNEMQLVSLFVQWAGVVKVPTTLKGFLRRGEGFARVTDAQVKYAVRMMR